jgi:hypothetical protein
VAGPSWLEDTFAAVVICVAMYAASRLAASRRWRRPTELDADGVHVLMGVAMAGTLAPRLSTLPSAAWDAVFGVAAAWFAWQAVRARRGFPAGIRRCRHPVPHLVESIAMVYMFLAVRAPEPADAGSGTAMPGMSASPGAVHVRALAFVMALYLLGYVVWIADRLTSMTPAAARGTAAVTADDPAGSLASCGQAAAASPHAAVAGSTPGTGHVSHMRAAGGAMLAPRLAACYKIAMGIAMGYMLIVMV